MENHSNGLQIPAQEEAQHLLLVLWCHALRWMGE